MFEFKWVPYANRCRIRITIILYNTAKWEVSWFNLYKLLIFRYISTNAYDKVYILLLHSCIKFHSKICTDCWNINRSWRIVFWLSLYSWWTTTWRENETDESEDSNTGAEVSSTACVTADGPWRLQQHQSDAVTHHQGCWLVEQRVAMYRHWLPGMFR